MVNYNELYVPYFNLKVSHTFLNIYLTPIKIHFL